MVVVYLPIKLFGLINSDPVNIYSAPELSVLNGNITSQSSLPGEAVITIDVYTVYNDGLDVGSNNTLIVNDTLIIYGDLILGNGSELIINDGAVCIVYGNVDVTNRIVMNFNSYFIVTGDLIHQGNANNVDLEVESDASIYVLGSVDEHFPTMVCDSSTTAAYDPPGDPTVCERGDIISLEDNENEEGGLYEWIVNNDTEKGITPVYSELCDGDVVTISLIYSGNGTNYQWRDSVGTTLAGETGNSFVASSSGEYYATFTDEDGNDITSHRSKVIVSSETLPVSPTINASPSSGSIVCVGESVSATFNSGSGGSGTITESYEYSVDGGLVWNSYTSGETITATVGMVGSEMIQIRTRRTGTGSSCDFGTYNYAKWTVVSVNSIMLTSGAGSNNQAVCYGQSITDITYTTEGATGATFSGLPTGLNESWNNDQINITGTPTQIGTFNYTVTLTGGCGTVEENGTIEIKELPSITLSSASADICPGETQVTFIYSATSGSPDKYNIDFDVTSEGAGLSDVIDATLSGGTINITGLETISVGTYNASLYVKNSTTGCLSSPYGITIVINTPPDTGEIIPD